MFKKKACGSLGAKGLAGSTYPIKRTLVPNIRKSMGFGTIDLEYWVLVRPVVRDSLGFCALGLAGVVGVACVCFAWCDHAAISKMNALLLGHSVPMTSPFTEFRESPEVLDS